MTHPLPDPTPDAATGLTTDHGAPSGTRSSTGSAIVGDRLRRSPRDTPGVLSTAAAGLVYLLTLFATPPDGPPVETATAAQIRAYLTTDATALRVQALALALAGVAVVAFAAGLATLLDATARHQSTDDRSAEGRSAGRRNRPVAGLPGLTLGGGLLVAGWHWITAATESSTAVQALDGTPLTRVDDAVLRSWYAATNITHLYGDIAMLGIAVLLTGACLGSLRTGLLPRWIAVLGLVAATAGTIGTAGVVLAIPALATVWFGGLFGWTVWLPCAAVGLVVRARRSRDRTSAT